MMPRLNSVCSQQKKLRGTDPGSSPGLLYSPLLCVRRFTHKFLSGTLTSARLCRRKQKARWQNSHARTIGNGRRARTMSKKSKPSKQKKRMIANASPVDSALDLIGHLIVQGDYQQAVAHCERLLNYLPQQAQQRAEVLSQLGVAHAMLQNFRKSYEVLTEALTFTPKNAELWYN